MSQRALFNRPALTIATRAGCYGCCTLFDVADIARWIDDDSTALCPHCGVDAVLASDDRHPLLLEDLTVLNEQWFGLPQGLLPWSMAGPPPGALLVALRNHGLQLRSGQVEVEDLDVLGATCIRTAGSPRVAVVCCPGDSGQEWLVALFTQPDAEDAVGEHHVCEEVDQVATLVAGLLGGGSCVDSENLQLPGGRDPCGGGDRPR